MTVQIYGTQKSQDSKKALRFFKERATQVQFFDLKTHYMTQGELARFIQKFGLQSLINSKAKAYQEAGLEYLKVPDEQMIEKLIEDPDLMIQPLVRSGSDLSVGWNEAFWKNWYKNLKST
ncbi:MAG: arsenate reductase family protein [Trueperaceae bacterium]|nr:arsenate reductase family protein [Trueperaceae bacterium]